MITIMSFGKSKRTIGRPNQALSEDDGHRLRTIPPDLQHSGRTSPIGDLDSCCGRGSELIQAWNTPLLSLCTIRRTVPCSCDSYAHYDGH